MQNSPFPESVSKSSLLLMWCIWEKTQHFLGFWSYAYETLPNSPFRNSLPFLVYSWHYPKSSWVLTQWQILECHWPNHLISSWQIYTIDLQFVKSVVENFTLWSMPTCHKLTDLNTLTKSHCWLLLEWSMPTCHESTDLNMLTKSHCTEIWTI